MTRLASVLMIRHGEKPHAGGLGVDERGNADPDGLTPQGWARAGALVTLFAPNSTTVNSALPSPDALVTPRYHKPVHRAYLTLLPLAQRLGVAILAEHPVDAHPAAVVDSLVAMDTGVVLLCWEHDHLVKIADAMAHTLPVANPDEVPAAWPDDRYDMIWRFDRDEQTQTWTFSSHDQQLLAGDSNPSEPGTSSARIVLRG
jgi:broad specificity phosphatase PhoE